MPSPLFIPATPRVHRKRRAVEAQLPGPVALTVVAADYEESVWLWLTFDRAVDIAGLVGSAIHVNDPSNGTLFAATGPATLNEPTVLQLGLVVVTDSSSGELSVTATSSTGIVAVDDGGTWGGVTNLELPFP